MQIDVVRLRDFYASPLGAVTARLVGGRIRELWPDAARRSILGLGYVTPYLGGYLPSGEMTRQARRVLAFMPAQQGAHPWPADNHKGNLVSLVQETALPLADASVDLVLLAHFLETSDSLKTVLREVWRVLADGGRVLAVAPNRTGAWALSERTPFGHGRTFSIGQLEDEFRSHMFTPLRRSASLFLPPLHSSAGIRSLAAVEHVGWRWWRRLGGVILLEAEKRMYALNGGATEPARARRLVTSSLSQN